MSNVKKSKWAAAPKATRRLPVPVRVLISRRRQHKRKGRLPAEVNTCRYSPSRPVHEKLSMVWASGRHMGKGGRYTCSNPSIVGMYVNVRRSCTYTHSPLPLLAHSLTHLPTYVSPFYAMLHCNSTALYSTYTKVRHGYLQKDRVSTEVPFPVSHARPIHTRVHMSAPCP